MEYWEAVQTRRSIYALRGESSVPDGRLEELLETALRHAPSSFDSRSSRLVLLRGEAHRRLWDLTLDALRPLVAPERLGATEKKLAIFSAGCGTLLFYEDQAVIHGLQERYPLYQEEFPHWAQQSSGMLQYMVWTGLTAVGMGATLQHYNPLIDRPAAEAFGIPGTWQLIAEMPFGVPAAQPAPRKREDLGDRFRVVER